MRIFKTKHALSRNPLGKLNDADGGAATIYLRDPAQGQEGVVF
jgi:hypothetical protein